MFVFLDKFFFLFHALLIGFSLFGWLWKKTRRANLIVLLLIAGSWFVLGLWYGIGYCPCTDWHWQVRMKLGHDDMPTSYVKFLFDSLTGLNLSAPLVDILTLTFYVLALAASLFTNVRALKHKYASPLLDHFSVLHLSVFNAMTLLKTAITIPFALCSLALLLACSQQESKSITTANPEQEYQSAHFKFLLTGFDHANIASIAQHLENNYARITGDLSASNLPVINIQFYSNQSALHQALNYPNAPAWVIGAATARDQIHMMSPNAPNLNRPFDEMLTNLVHEFTHCVALNLEPRSGNNPRWLWEGVALYEAGQFVNPRRLSYMVEGHPPTLAELNVNWQANTQVYDLGYLLVEYVVEKWSRQHVVDLVKTFGNISSVLGISVSEFEAGWYAFVTKKY